MSSDGVMFKDKDISTHLGKSIDQIQQYTNDDAKVNVSSFTTDAGGGGGTKEGCANEFCNQFPEMMYDVWYVVTCMLHGNSKLLEKVWLQAFGEFGTGKKTVGQFIYQCWYIQNKLGNAIFKNKWKKITGRKWVGNILCRPIISRWGYPLKTAEIVFKSFDLWETFLYGLVIGTNKSSNIGQEVDDAIGLIKTQR